MPRRPRWRQAAWQCATPPSLSAGGGPGTDVGPFVDDPPEMRRPIYPTNSIEASTSKIRRSVRARTVREWPAVKRQLVTIFEDRFSMRQENVSGYKFRMLADGRQRGRLAATVHPHAELP